MAADIDHGSTERYLTRLEDGLRAALTRASGFGETDPLMIGQRCEVLTAAVLGVNITHRNDGSGIRASNLISALRLEVNSWTLPQ
jgi:hypothetical protein